MKKVFIFIIAIVLVGLAVYYVNQNNRQNIGGDRDAHGCLVAAGYTFDETVGACIRAFEMTPDIKNAAALAVSHVGKSYALTVVSFNSYEEVGAYDIMLEKGVERTPVTVIIKNWKVQEVNNVKNLTFAIDGSPVTLTDGISRVPIPNSASSITTQYFGNESSGDIDGDGDRDVVFIATQDGGGSGIFFFLVGAINEMGGDKGTQAFLIGDRIAPQPTHITILPADAGRLVVVNYADRKPGEAMAAVPSVGKSLYLTYQPETHSFVSVLPQTKYIRAINWPPHVEMSSASFTCEQTDQSHKRTIGDTTYCVTTTKEGAAGSVYTQYTYAYPYQEGTAILTFTMRFPQCANYDTPQRTECEAEESAFNADSIVATLRTN